MLTVRAPTTHTCTYIHAYDLIPPLHRFVYAVLPKFGRPGVEEVIEPVFEITFVLVVKILTKKCRYGTSYGSASAEVGSAVEKVEISLCKVWRVRCDAGEPPASHRTPQTSRSAALMLALS